MLIASNNTKHGRTDYESTGWRQVEKLALRVLGAVLMAAAFTGAALAQSGPLVLERGGLLDELREKGYQVDAPDGTSP